MLLFSDGFDYFEPRDLRNKWGGFWVGNPVGQGEPYNSNDINQYSKIVSGVDPINGKPYATKDGKALLISGRMLYELVTSFKPSRTIFAGLAFRATDCYTASDKTTYVTKTITFRNRIEIDRGGTLYEATNYGPRSALLSTLTLKIYQFKISITWAFTNGSTQVGDINTNADMLNGDYHYIQFGFTLSGNSSAQPRAWAEVRLGNRGVGIKFQDILTGAADGAGEMFINYIGIKSAAPAIPGVTNSTMAIDDFYLANDEGFVNNTFLGNVKVRSVLPTAEGSINDSSPSTGVYRHSCVNEPFIGQNLLPSVPPNDPLYIPWVNQYDSYITLSAKGDTQLLRFATVPFEGSQPKIIGAIVFVLAKAKYRGLTGKTALQGLKKYGLGDIELTTPTDAPLSFSRIHIDTLESDTGTWQTYPIVYDNDEVVAEGQPYYYWSPSVFSNTEFGFKLDSCTLNPLFYGQNLTRFSLTTYEEVSDTFHIDDFCHRFFEEIQTDSIELVDSQPEYEYTWLASDGFYIDEQDYITLQFPRFINETIEFDDIVPWLYDFNGDYLNFSDEVYLQFLDVIDEDLTMYDWNTGFAEELILDTFDSQDISALATIILLDETFDITESYLGDNHELLDDTFSIDADEPWDNHELAEEYVNFESLSVQGIGLEILDTLDIIEEHYDGWWVNQTEDNLSTSDSVLSQHWRYETSFGIVLNSYQVSPIEQVGEDGNHTGNNPWGS